jgi:hypothetical protein
MKIACPTCRTEVPAADINIQAMTALCRSCNEVFAVAPAHHAGIPVGLPARFTLADEGSRRWGVSWRWWRWQHIFLIFFCCAWDAFLVFWYAAAIFGNAKGGGGMGLFMIIFPVCHVAVGVGLTYYVIAALCNRTWIACDGDTLTIRHGPIPWGGGRSVPLHELRDVRVDAHYQEDSSPRFAVIAVRNGKDLALVKDLDHDEADWMRQQLTGLLAR